MRLSDGILREPTKKALWVSMPESFLLAQNCPNICSGWPLLTVAKEKILQKKYCSENCFSIHWGRIRLGATIIINLKHFCVNIVQFSTKSPLCGATYLLNQIFVRVEGLLGSSSGVIPMKKILLLLILFRLQACRGLKQRRLALLRYIGNHKIDRYHRWKLSLCGTWPFWGI